MGPSRCEGGNRLREGDRPPGVTEQGSDKERPGSPGCLSKLALLWAGTRASTFLATGEGVTLVERETGPLPRAPVRGRK